MKIVEKRLREGLYLTYLQDDPRNWLVTDYKPATLEDLTACSRRKRKSYEETKTNLNIPSHQEIRHTTSNSDWWLYCDLCKEDVYALSNGSSHCFRSTKKLIVKGSGCRCNNNHKLSEEDKHLRCNIILKKYHLTLLHSQDTDYTFCCEKGHTTTLTYNRITGVKFKGCSTCNTSKGAPPKLYVELKHNRKRGKDFLYLMKFRYGDEAFLKIGRSYFPEHRRHILDKTTYSVEILDTIEGTHEEVVNLERQLHFQYRNQSYRPKFRFGGSTECFKFGENITSLRTLCKAI